MILITLPINFYVDIFLLIIILGLLVFFIFRSHYDYLLSNLFVIMLVFASVSLLLDIPIWVLEGKEGDFIHELEWALNSLYFIIQPILVYVWVLYVIYRVYESKKVLLWSGLALLIPILYGLILVSANTLNGDVFYIDHNNVFMTNRLYSLSIIIYIVYIAISLIVVITGVVRFKQKRARDMLMLLVYMIFPTIGMIFDMYCALNEKFTILYPCFTISLYLVFFYDLRKTKLIDSRQSGYQIIK